MVRNGTGRAACWSAKSRLANNTRRALGGRQHRLGPAFLALLACAVGLGESARAGDPVPLKCQQSLSPLANFVGAQVGSSVDADGAYAVAGTDRDQASLFQRDPAGWTYRGPVFPPAPTAGDFGRGVRLQGTTLCCSEPQNSTAVASGGALHVFEESAGIWNFQATLRPSDPVAGEQFTFFNRSFDVWGDWIAVGSPSKGGGVGAIYLFQRTGGVWTQTDKIVAPLPFPGFGRRVELGDRSMVVQHDFGTEVYARQGTQWFWIQELTTPLGAAITGPLRLAGDRIVASPGARGAGDPENGRVNVYRFVANGWMYESGFLTDHPPSIPATVSIQDVDIHGNRIVAVKGSGLPFVLVYEEGLTGWQPVVDYQQQHSGDYWASGGVALLQDEVVIGFPFSWPPGGLLLGDYGSVEFGSLAAAPAEYCTGKRNSDGCHPRIGSSGVPSLSGDLPATSFTVTLDDAIGQKAGMLFYGYASGALPFLDGTLCIQPPLRRTTVQLGGGDVTPCSGTFAFDFLDLLQAGSDPFLVAGADAYCQWWSRDPGDPTGTGLSDGLALTVWP